MQEEWYVELDGAANGPHERAAVVQLHQLGRIDSHTLVWRAGFPDWMGYAAAGLDIPHDPPPLPPPSERDEQDAMRRVIARRNGSRRHAEAADGLPENAPKLEVEDDGWQWSAPAPWRRYFARVLDIFLLGTFTWMVFTIISAATNQALFATLFRRGGLMGVPYLSNVVLMASLIPVQALLLGTSGTTVGKWIFGVRITRRDGSAIGIRAALGREVGVFCLGMLGGIPLLAFVPICISYRVLTRTGSTSWDRGKDWVVTQREPGDTQTTMFTLGILILVIGGGVLGVARGVHA
ncbi:RDD family protein [Dyella mobilis]|uniref:RDD family protein n=1 Tax=Dyella mobilis TaxID=1849582 RepID=A0ABS2KM93_9GAMM|nr:RDD family protein [Dyella mobilis]MBM7132209.1 RDD family protein [Dyella mobilis]GLQ95805.1 hypothetical protein GCM10007863_02230 [Dyella mobilis]